MSFRVIRACIASTDAAIDANTDDSSAATAAPTSTPPPEPPPASFRYLLLCCCFGSRYAPPDARCSAPSAGSYKRGGPKDSRAMPGLFLEVETEEPPSRREERRVVDIPAEAPSGGEHACTCAHMLVCENGRPHVSEALRVIKRVSREHIDKRARVAGEDCCGGCMISPTRRAS